MLGFILFYIFFIYITTREAGLTFSALVISDGSDLARYVEIGECKMRGIRCQGERDGDARQHLVSCTAFV